MGLCESVNFVNFALFQYIAADIITFYGYFSLEVLHLLFIFLIVKCYSITALVWTAISYRCMINKFISTITRTTVIFLLEYGGE